MNPAMEPRKEPVPLFDRGGASANIRKPRMQSASERRLIATVLRLDGATLTHELRARRLQREWDQVAA